VTYIQTEPPDCEPLSLKEALDHLRVTAGEDHVYVQGLIAKARRYCESLLGRQLITATWELRLDEFPDEIVLEKVPVQEVTKITYTDWEGRELELDEAEYQVDPGGEGAPARVMPAYGSVGWPATRSDTYNAVVIEFDAGFGDAPEDVPPTIRHLLLLLLTHWFEHREPTSEKVLTGIPLAVESLLAAEDWGNYK
jgi:uncharacterized phiE125 gp8 family phage protein